MISKPRSSILARLRHRQFDGDSPLPPAWTGPLNPKADLVSRFIAAAEKVHCSVHRLGTTRELVAAVEGLAQDGMVSYAKIGVEGSAWLTGLAWPVDVNVGPRPVSCEDHQIVVTDIDYGLADTGSLVYIEDQAKSLNAVMAAETHIAVLPLNRLLPHAEQAMENMIDEKLARRMIFITGPSRTADIELSLILGAHGPRKLHILLIENLEQDVGA